MKKLKQIVVAVLLVYLFGVQIASAITVGNGNVSTEAPVYTFYAGETELGYGNIAKGNTLFPDGTWETFESGSFPLMAKITNASGALGGTFVIKYDTTKVTPLTYQTGRPGSWVDATEGKKVWYASEFSGEIGASSTTSGVYVDGLYGYVYANWIASSGAIDAEQFIEEGCNPELGCFVFRTNDGVTIEDFDAETFTVVTSTLPEGAIKEGLASNGSPLTCNVKTAEGNMAYGISDEIQRLPMTVEFSYPNSNVLGATMGTNVWNPINPVQNQELTVYAPQENVSETQQSITQTGTVQTDVALIYNQKYYENVLLPGQTLSVPITISNESGTAKEIVSYVSKYSLTGQLTEVAQLGILTVPANETLTTTLTHTFSTETTCTAKILFWESDTLKPIENDIYLTMDAQDSYGDTYADAYKYQFDKQLCGVINTNEDMDILKFTPNVTGVYKLEVSASGGTACGLYNASQELINSIAVDAENGSMLFELIVGQDYFVCFSGIANNAYEIIPSSSAEFMTAVEDEGIANSMEDTGEFHVYKFVPEVSGTYIVTAVDGDGVQAELYNASFEKIASSAEGDEYVSFRITSTMTAGETYYVIVTTKAEEQPGSYTLYVEEPFALISIE